MSDVMNESEDGWCRVEAGIWGGNRSCSKAGSFELFSVLV